MFLKPSLAYITVTDDEIPRGRVITNPPELFSYNGELNGVPLYIY